jgi:ubiquitin-protein ligase
MSGLRLAKELEQLTKDPIEGILFGADSDNLFRWKFTIYGLKGTPYEGGIYEGEITYTNKNSLVLNFQSAFSGNAYLS